MASGHARCRAEADDMHLDIPTLLVVLFLTTGILATSVLVVAWRDRAHDGLGLWGIGLLLNWIS